MVRPSSNLLIADIAMSKSVVEYTARRVTYDTPLPIAEVIARLDQEINKAGGGPEVLRLLSTAQTRAELEDGVSALTAGRDFVYVHAIALSADADRSNRT